jgi:hypothetical protein
LFTVVSSLSLRKQGSFSSFVLSDFVWRVFAAILPFAESISGFRDIHLLEKKSQTGI